MSAGGAFTGGGPVGGIGARRCAGGGALNGGGAGAVVELGVFHRGGGIGRASVEPPDAP